MILGEAFVNEVKEYCCSGELSLPGNFNLLSLFKKVTEKEFDIDFREKNEMDISKQELKSSKKVDVEKHMISALLYLLSPKELNEVRGTITARNLEQPNWFLRESNEQKFGILTDNTDKKLYFIHRCFAEYFVAEWFTDNFSECEEFISNILFKPMNEVTWNIFNQMLAENSEIHNFVLNNDIHVLKEIQKNKTDISIRDKGGRTALHFAASYNSPIIHSFCNFQVLTQTN
jgi:hypothetical protein